MSKSSKNIEEPRKNMKMIMTAAIIAVILAIIIVIAIFSSMTEKQTVEYDMKAFVVENVSLGISGDLFELNFGRMPLYAASTKYVELNYDSALPARVNIELNGNISKFIILEKKTYNKYQNAKELSGHVVCVRDIIWRTKCLSLKAIYLVKETNMIIVSLTIKKLLSLHALLFYYQRLCLDLLYRLARVQTLL